jgi:CRISPR system Cascade subunit CasD
MRVLAFRLFGPLAAWGTGEAGETDRPTADHPGRSAIVGLLGAALGLRREDERAHADLAASFRLAVTAQGDRRVLRDYRTVQTVEPGRQQRKTGFVSRKHALAAGDKVHTMITRRQYIQDGLWRVFLAPRPEAVYTPDDLAAALRRPVFELYLGRRDCPLALPPDPQVIDADGIDALLTAYPALPAYAVNGKSPALGGLAKRLADQAITLAWEPGFPGAPAPETPGTARRDVADEPLSRTLRRFARREERIRRIANPEAPSDPDATEARAP